jgi:hypothetical protein
MCIKIYKLNDSRIEEISSTTLTMNHYSFNVNTCSKSIENLFDKMISITVSADKYL